MPGKAILFDSGADAKILVGNMKALGVEKGEIDIVVISHMHNDHIGGIKDVLDGDLTVPARIDEAPGTYLTGAMGRGTKERALIIDTPSGPVLITGCAHPGIVEIVERAKESLGEAPYMVLGGFHLMNADDADVREIISRLKALGVRKCGAGHCAGDNAIRLFREAYGDDFVSLGTGTLIVLE